MVDVAGEKNRETTPLTALKFMFNQLYCEARVKNICRVTSISSLRVASENCVGSRAVVCASVAAGLVAIAGSARAVQDPFATPGAASAAPGVPTPATAAPAADALGGTTCEHITAALCDKQNNTMLALDGGYVVGAVFLAALIRAWFNKRATGSNAFRFLFPMLLAVAGAGALTGTDPARGADLTCCLLNPTFRDHVLLQGT